MKAITKEGIIIAAIVLLALGLAYTLTRPNLDTSPGYAIEEPHNPQTGVQAPWRQEYLNTLSFKVSQ